MSAGSGDESPNQSVKSNNSGVVALQNGSTANSAMSKPYVSTFHLIPSNDLSQRISMGSWHPKENTFAVAKHNSLFLFTEKRSSGGKGTTDDREESEK
jgi:hypothetical protein